MADLRLTACADLGLMYDIEQQRYPAELTALATRERTLAHYRGCASVGYEIDGVAAGGAIFDGHELHLAVLPQYHGRWAWLLKPTLDWLFAQCDPVRVRIEQDNTRCIRFMDSGGWERVAEDPQYITYLLSSSAPHVFRRRRAAR
ncbi:GNAT family N-acetyltransferase [Massilia atriviolacea]|uniref:GNAT family N-acetyltransferase n=1 Tax=Massilia atriviolacea TaxID=2495579 RepID=A0A430HU34_9BURK|nr:GNAT family N-acetyltransferase [Massilia atriviolacea]RSZ61081.1 GNAT family N-acetyltransferase [Massilia atriviolacea]